jgi:hypothetical protein
MENIRQATFSHWLFSLQVQVRHFVQKQNQPALICTQKQIKTTSIGMYTKAN